MADDNRKPGHRPSGGYDRPRNTSAQQGGDPLAELARLIGRQNEAAPSYRQNGAWPQTTHDRQPQVDPYAAPYAPGPADERYVQGSRYPDEAYPEQRYDPSYADPRYGEPQHYDPHYADPHYADPRYADPRYADPRYTDPRYGDQHYGDASGYAPQTEGASHGYPDDRYAYAPQPANYGAPPFAHSPGYDDPYYAPAPQPPAREGIAPARRRAGIVTALAVLALAVVGTAAAFGYRAMFGSSGTAVPPPVIKADTRPTKVVPPTDANAKPIQDRIGVKTERVVSREEQPVELRDPARGSNPRVVFPNIGGQNAGPTQTIANIAPTGAVPAAAPEPKKVRTVAIRPDRSPETAPSRASASRSAVEPDNAAPAVPAPRPQAASPGNAPLPLAPGAQSPAQPQRQASRGNVGGTPFPAPISSSSPAATGAYAVQVTSQRSEADAQAAFRSLQSQFPSVLGNRQAIIRRADLGEKGTYYRAQIGPFASQSEASEFCGSLKSAGGQCVVQKN